MRRTGQIGRRVFATIFTIAGFSLQALAFFLTRFPPSAEAATVEYLAEKLIVAVIGGTLALCGVVLLATLRSR